MEQKFSHATAPIFLLITNMAMKKFFSIENVHFTIAYYLLRFHFVEMLLNFRNAFIVVFPESA